LTDDASPRFVRDPDLGPTWDGRGERLPGLRLLVGNTVLHADENVVGHQQFHGIVEVADPGDGIALRRHDTGELEWLAPDLRAFAVAAPGEYRLRSTGEVVSDPDVLATGTLYGPASGD
jgi:hypothetical protein